MISPPPPYDEAALGVAIGRIRLEEGLTLDQLAERSGVSRRQLIDIEQANKTPLITTLHAIAHALNLTVGDLADFGCIHPDEVPAPVETA